MRGARGLATGGLDNGGDTGGVLGDSRGLQCDSHPSSFSPHRVQGKSLSARSGHQAEVGVPGMCPLCPQAVQREAVPSALFSSILALPAPCPDCRGGSARGVSPVSPSSAEGSWSVLCLCSPPSWLCQPHVRTVGLRAESLPCCQVPNLHLIVPLGEDQSRGGLCCWFPAHPWVTAGSAE